MLYTIILNIHNIMRWVVILTGAYAVFRAMQNEKVWDSSANLARSLFVNSMNIQFILGIILYEFSPLMQEPLSVAIKDPQSRFFLIEHPTIMIAALALGHIGSAKVRKATTDKQKYKFAKIFFSISLILVLAGVPWLRRLLPV